MKTAVAPKTPAVKEVALVANSGLVLYIEVPFFSISTISFAPVGAVST
jgi:hypothetical protein